MPLLIYSFSHRAVSFTERRMLQEKIDSGLGGNAEAGDEAIAIAEEAVVKQTHAQCDTLKTGVEGSGIKNITDLNKLFPFIDCNVSIDDAYTEDTNNFIRESALFNTEVDTEAFGNFDKAQSSFAKSVPEGLEEIYSIVQDEISNSNTITNNSDPTAQYYDNLIERFIDLGANENEDHSGEVGEYKDYKYKISKTPKNENGSRVTISFYQDTGLLVESSRWGEEENPVLKISIGYDQEGTITDYNLDSQNNGEGYGISKTPNYLTASVMKTSGEQGLSLYGEENSSHIDYSHSYRYDKDGNMMTRELDGETVPYHSHRITYSKLLGFDSNYNYQDVYWRQKGK